MQKKANRLPVSRHALRTHGGNMIFMLPTILLFVVVVLIPFFQGIPYSLR